MILRKMADAIRGQNWFTVVLEVLIVVVGIFIGLQVNDWNQARKDAANEQIYLQELLEDMEANLEQIDVAITTSEEILPAMISLLEQSALEEPRLSVAELNFSFSQIHHMPSVTAVTRAFSNLTGSGDLKLITNRALKNDLAQYYAAMGTVVLVMDTHEMELVQTFQPYVIEHMDYQAVPYERIDDYPLPPPVNEDRILEVLPTALFRNIVTQKWVIVTDLMNQFRGVKGQTENIIRILEEDIAQ